MFSIRLGSSFYSSGGEIVPVKEIFQHPKFNYRTIDFDYAILSLETEIEFSETKKPIELPKQNENFEDESMVSTSGWGNTLNWEESRSQLRTVRVPIFNQEKCEKAYKGSGEVTVRMVCAGFEEGGRDACQG